MIAKIIKIKIKHLVTSAFVFAYNFTWFNIRGFAVVQYTLEDKTVTLAAFKFMNLKFPTQICPVLRFSG